MTTNFERVKEFTDTFDVAKLSDNDKYMTTEVITTKCLDLIQEELNELRVAVQEKNSIETLDAITDLLYVTYQMGYIFGYDVDEAFKRVHESNMSKLDEDGQPIFRDDGKVLKGPNFKEPVLKDLA